MTKITKFDKTQCRLIGDAVEAALKEVGERLGLVIKVGGGTFDAVEFTQKLKITIDDPEVADAAARKIFDQYCGLYDLLPAHWGIEMTVNGVKHRLCGIDTRRPKFAIKMREVTSGVLHQFSTAIVPRIRAVAVARGIVTRGQDVKDEA